MSNPNLDSRYAKPADVAAAISTQAVTDAGQYLTQTNASTTYLTKTDIRLGPSPSGDTTGATDTPAIQAALNALLDGQTLVLRSGAFYLNAEVTLNRSNVVIKGSGSGSSDATQTSGTRFIVSSTTNNGVVVAQNGVTLEDFAVINNAASIPTGGIGIRCTAGRYMRFHRLSVFGFYDNVDIETGIYYSISKCTFLDPVRYGLRLRNIASGGFDTGDQIIEGNTISVVTATRGNPTAAIRWESGGGPKIANNKVNGNTGTGQFATGIDASVSDGGTTVDMLITGNSIENTTSAGIHVGQAGTTGLFSKITIVGNEIGSGSIPDAVRIDATALNFIFDLTITSNVVGPVTRSGIWLQNVSRVAVSANMMRGNFTQAGIYVNGCQYIDVAPNVISGTFSTAAVLIGSTYSYSVSVARQNVEITSGSNTPILQDNRASQFSRVIPGRLVFDEEREIPSTTSNSTYTKLYRFQVPQGYGGGTLEFTAGGLVTGGDSFAIYASRLVTRANTSGSVVTLTTIGTDTVAGTVVDYSFDTATTAGEIIVSVKLNSSTSATNLSAFASIRYTGPISRVIRV